MMDESEREEALEETESEINDTTGSDNMTQMEALEWLVELKSRIDGMIGGLRSDLGLGAGEGPS